MSFPQESNLEIAKQAWWQSPLPTEPSDWQGTQESSEEFIKSKQPDTFQSLLSAVTARVEAMWEKRGRNDWLCGR